MAQNTKATLRNLTLLALELLALSAPWSSHFVPAAAALARAPKACGSDSYVNVDGNCIHRPDQASRPPLARLPSVVMALTASVSIGVELVVGTVELLPGSKPAPA